MKKRTLIVENIPENWDDLILESYLARFGKIENCYILDSKSFNHKRPCRGIVIYTKRSSAEKSFIEKYVFYGEGDKNYLRVYYKDELTQKIQVEKCKEEVEKRKIIQKNKRMISRPQLNDFLKKYMKKGLKKFEENDEVVKDDLSYHQLKPTKKEYFESPTYLRMRLGCSFNGLNMSFCDNRRGFNFYVG